MKKIFFSFIALIVFSTLSFGSCIATGEAKLNVPLPKFGYDEIMVNNKIHNIVDKEDNSINALRKILTNRGQDAPLQITNHVLATIAIVWLMILGVKFAFAQGNEEKITKYKQQFGWVALGLAVISLAEYIAFDVFDPTENILEGSASGNFNAKAMQIKLYFQILVTGIAVAVCVMSGYNLITAATEDETITNEKRFMRSFLFGVGFVFLAEAIVRIVSFQKEWNQGEPLLAAKQSVQEAVGIINFMLTFVAASAVFMLILASLYYVTSFGNDDQTGRAKQIIISAVVAVIVVLTSYAFVNFFVR